MIPIKPPINRFIAKFMLIVINFKINLFRQDFLWIWILCYIFRGSATVWKSLYQLDFTQRHGRCDCYNLVFC